MILSVLYMTAVFPNLYRIDDILPEHITAGADRCYRVEVHIRYPYREGGVLLEHGLAGVDMFTKLPADGPSDEEMKDTGNQGE